MFLYIPFIVFLISFIIVYKRNGFDLASCILLAYTATSLVSIVLAGSGMQYDADLLSPLPVVLHCVFTLALTFPFILFNSNKKRDFPLIRNVKLFESVCTVFIVLFFIEVLATFPILISRLTASDAELAAIRAEAYQGEVLMDLTMGFLPHSVETILNILSVGSPIMLVFFFYSICFLKKSNSFNILLLLSSMSALIYSIITVDRSKLFFWVLLFLMAFFLYKPYLPKKQKRFVFGIMTPIVVFFIIYFVGVTVARFGDSDMGSEGSLLSYAGQPLFNLCFLWDVLPGTSINLKGVFPLTYYFFETLFGVRLAVGSNVYSTMALSDLNGFNALIGYGVREVGHSLTVVLLCLLTLIMHTRIGRIANATTLSLHSVMTVFLLGTIVICGFIAYYYSSWPHAVMFWLFVYLTKKIN